MNEHDAPVDRVPVDHRFQNVNLRGAAAEAAVFDKAKKFSFRILSCPQSKIKKPLGIEGHRNYFSLQRLGKETNIKTL